MDAKYDMGKFCGKNRIGTPTKMSLYSELSNETGHTIDAIEKCFHNRDRSGICDKLEDKLGFKIDSFIDPENDFESKVSIFKLLKLLYRYEKDDKCNPFERKYRITNILARPQLSNIKKSDYTITVYGDVLNSIMEELEKEVKDCTERKDLIEKLDIWWECVCELIFSFFLSDNVIGSDKNSKEQFIADIRKIKTDLETVESLLSNCSEINSRHKESAIESFYNILVCHKSNCMDADKLRLEINGNQNVDKQYARFFLQNEAWGLKENQRPNDLTRELQNSFLNRNFKDPDIQSMMKLIEPGWESKKRISKDKRNEYLSSLEFVDVLMEWIIEEKKASYCNCAIYAAALQVIMRVRKEHTKIHEKYYGDKKKSYPLLSPLIAASGANINGQVSEFAKQKWIRLVEIRCAINIGENDMVEKFYEIQKVIYSIKALSYRYQNFEDILYASKFLLKCVYEIIKKNIDSQAGEDFESLELNSKISEKLNRSVKIVWTDEMSILVGAIYYSKECQIQFLNSLCEWIDNEGEGDIKLQPTKYTLWLNELHLKAAIHIEEEEVYIKIFSSYYYKRTRNECIETVDRLKELGLTNILECILFDT